MKRRQFVKTGAITMGGIQVFSIIGCDSKSGAGDEVETASNYNANEALFIPPLEESHTSDGVKVFKLTLQKSEVEWVKDNPTATFGVNGKFLGPTLKLTSGEKVRIEVKNELGEESTLHLHGLHIPAKSDGGPYSTIAADETWITEFTVENRDMMAWYHPHSMHNTGRQVAMGLAGCIFIGDTNSSADLPNEYGVDDIPLVIQDRNFSEDGTHTYSPDKSLTQHSKMMGVKGQSILVNGGITPIHRISKNLVRFRVLNGSNARIYNLGFSDDRDFSIVGTDGGLLEKPLSTNRVLLAPAERVEIVANFSDDSTETNLSLQSFSGEVSSQIGAPGMGGMGGMGVMQESTPENYDTTTFDIMSFAFSEISGDATVPAELSTIAAFDSTGATERLITLSMRRGNVYINDTQMTNMTNVPEAINFQIPIGSKEVWTIKNDSPMAHPFHVHDVQFQVIDVDDSPPSELLSGLKDTVLVLPKQTLRIGMTFKDFADPTTPYMFHCHILEHEDNGMMGQFFIV